MEEMEDKQNGKDPVWKNRVRMAIYPMAGVYIISQAYHMVKALPTASGNEHTLMIVFSILFAVIGIGLIIFGFAGVKKNADHMQEQQKDLENQSSKEK